MWHQKIKIWRLKHKLATPCSINVTLGLTIKKEHSLSVENSAEQYVCSIRESNRRLEKKMHYGKINNLCLAANEGGWYGWDMQEVLKRWKIYVKFGRKPWRGESTWEIKTQVKENIAISREYYSLRLWTTLKCLSTNSTVKVFKYGKGIWADPNGQAV